MTLALTILAGALIALLGLIGLWRDVQRGFLSLVGTVLGVVLVQLWGVTWATWLEQKLSWAPSTAGWVASSLTFLLVALFVGYGSGSLVARPKPLLDSSLKPRGKALARPAGALLGLLNGALIASVLLLYAREWSANETLQAAISDSFVLALLIDWFPWFVLGVALLIGVQAFAKWSVATLIVISRLATPRQPPLQPQQAQQPKAQQPAPKATTVVRPSGATQATPDDQKRVEAQNEAEHQAGLRRAAQRISQQLGERPPER